MSIEHKPPEPLFAFGQPEEVISNHRNDLNEDVLALGKHSGRKLNNEQREEIVRLYQDGKDEVGLAIKLAALFQIGRKTIYRVLDQAGVERRSQGHRPKQIQLPVDRLVERYEQGESINKLAKEYRVARGTIRNRLEEQGVQFREIAKKAFDSQSKL